MPTFDFQCRKCDHVFEHSRPFGSSELPACPACGSKRTEKMIAPPAIHFKGSGWYKTDSRATPGSSTPSKKEEKKSEDIKTDAKTSESETAGKKPEKKEPKKVPEKKS